MSLDNQSPTDLSVVDKSTIDESHRLGLKEIKNRLLQPKTPAFYLHLLHDLDTGLIDPNHLLVQGINLCRSEKDLLPIGIAMRYPIKPNISVHLTGVGVVHLAIYTCKKTPSILRDIIVSMLREKGLDPQLPAFVIFDPIEPIANPLTVDEYLKRENITTVDREKYQYLLDKFPDGCRDGYTLDVDQLIAYYGKQQYPKMEMHQLINAIKCYNIVAIRNGMEQISKEPSEDSINIELLRDFLLSTLSVDDALVTSTIKELIGYCDQLFDRFSQQQPQHQYHQQPTPLQLEVMGQYGIEVPDHEEGMNQQEKQLFSIYLEDGVFSFEMVNDLISSAINPKTKRLLTEEEIDYLYNLKSFMKRLGYSSRESKYEVESDSQRVTNLAKLYHLDCPKLGDTSTPLKRLQMRCQLHEIILQIFKTI